MATHENTVVIYVCEKYRFDLRHILSDLTYHNYEVCLYMVYIIYKMEMDLQSTSLISYLNYATTQDPKMILWSKIQKNNETKNSDFCSLRPVFPVPQFHTNSHVEGLKLKFQARKKKKRKENVREKRIIARTNYLEWK